MLIVVTALAVMFALSAQIGASISAVLMMLIGLAILISLPIVFGTLALYCRGYRQTFFLGAFVGALAPLFQSGMGIYSDWFGHWFVTGLLFCFNILCALGSGWLALATRRFAERRGWNLPPKAEENNPSK